MDIQILTDLLGKTIESIGPPDLTDAEEVFLHLTNGEVWRMMHHQDCCESVSLYDIAGDIADLIGSPLVEAEEVSSSESPEGLPEDSESQTWTFYKFGTTKGFAVLRWWGTSNGYYSESVEIARIKDADPPGPPPGYGGPVFGR